MAITRLRTVLARRDMGAHGLTLTARGPAGTVFQLFCRPRQHHTP